MFNKLIAFCDNTRQTVRPGSKCTYQIRFLRIESVFAYILYEIVNKQCRWGWYYNFVIVCILYAKFYVLMIIIAIYAHFSSVPKRKHADFRILPGHIIRPLCFYLPRIYIQTKSPILTGSAYKTSHFRV